MYYISKQRSAATGISSAIFFRLRDFQPANHTKKSVLDLSPYTDHT